MILVDSWIPGGCSGVDIYRWVANNQPGLEKRVVLTLSDMTDSEVSAFVEENGVATITKPFEVSDLIAMAEAPCRRQFVVARTLAYRLGLVQGHCWYMRSHFWYRSRASQGTYGRKASLRGSALSSCGKPSQNRHQSDCKWDAFGKQKGIASPEEHCWFPRTNYGKKCRVDRSPRYIPNRRSWPKGFSFKPNLEMARQMH